MLKSFFLKSVYLIKFLNSYVSLLISLISVYFLLFSLLHHFFHLCASRWIVILICIYYYKVVISKQKKAFRCCQPESKPKQWHPKLVTLPLYVYMEVSFLSIWNFRIPRKPGTISSLMLSAEMQLEKKKKIWLKPAKLSMEVILYYVLG